MIQDSRRQPLQVLVVLLGLREGETVVARLLCELRRSWGDRGEISGRLREITGRQGSILPHSAILGFGTLRLVWGGAYLSSKPT